jgi:hypothetical protein
MPLLPGDQYNICRSIRAEVTTRATIMQDESRQLSGEEHAVFWFLSSIIPLFSEIFIPPFLLLNLSYPGCGTLLYFLGTPDLKARFACAHWLISGAQTWVFSKVPLYSLNFHVYEKSLLGEMTMLWNGLLILTLLPPLYILQFPRCYLWNSEMFHHHFLCLYTAISFSKHIPTFFHYTGSRQSSICSVPS